MNDVLDYFPQKLKKEIQDIEIGLLEEIRIRTNRKVILKIGQEEIVLEYVIKQNEILEILQKICDNSIYTYQNQICNGYITIKGGHRVGITGNVVLKEGRVINISHIYSLNFRIAKQIIGCSKNILKHILNLSENTIYNSMIVSPPGRGKTTLLRDCIRSISNGMSEFGFKGVNIGVVDERGEIGAMYRGVPQNDLGERCDILDNVPKDIGMKMLVRSMNPKIIVADEIGTKEDVQAINYGICSGVKGLFTAHGGSLKEIILNPILKQLYELNIIEKIILINSDRSLKLIYNQGGNL